MWWPDKCWKIALHVQVTGETPVHAAQAFYCPVVISIFSGVCFTAMKIRLLHAAARSMKAPATYSHGRKRVSFVFNLVFGVGVRVGPKKFDFLGDSLVAGIRADFQSQFSWARVAFEIVYNDEWTAGFGEGVQRD